MGIRREFTFLALTSSQQVSGAPVRGGFPFLLRLQELALGRETMESGDQAVPGPAGRALAEAA